MTTLRRILKRHEIESRLPVQRPYLSIRSKKRRLAFAKAHSDWTTDDWKNVVFSDESMFLIGAPYGLQRYLCRAVQAPIVQPTFSQGRDSMMIWGGIHGTGKTQLYIHNPPGLKSKGYIDVLREYMLPEISNCQAAGCAM